MLILVRSAHGDSLNISINEVTTLSRVSLNLMNRNCVLYCEISIKKQRESFAMLFIGSLHFR